MTKAQFDRQFLEAVNDALEKYEAGDIDGDEACTRMLAWYVEHHKQLKSEKSRLTRILEDDG